LDSNPNPDSNTDPNPDRYPNLLQAGARAETGSGSATQVEFATDSVVFVQCCGSGMPDPDFYPSRIPDLGSQIPDPKTATKERGDKKLVVIPFYVATNFTKLKIILVLKC